MPRWCLAVLLALAFLPHQASAQSDAFLVTAELLDFRESQSCFGGGRVSLRYRIVHAEGHPEIEGRGLSSVVFSRPSLPASDVCGEDAFRPGALHELRLRSREGAPFQVVRVIECAPTAADLVERAMLDALSR